MIDYYQAYSFYALLIIGATIVCIIVAAFFCAYMFAKLSKNVWVFVWIALLISFLCLPVARFMTLVSPSVQLLNGYISFQRHAAIVAAVILVPAALNIWICGIYKKSFYGMAWVYIMHFICTFYLIDNSSRVLADLTAILDFASLSLFMVVTGPVLFTELSPVSIDRLMQKIEDIILIFGQSGKLIDSSCRAKDLFPFLKDGLPIHEFINNIKEMTISQEYIDISDITGREKQGDIELRFAEGEKCFRYSITPVKYRKRNTGAVVVSLHDATENYVLQKELKTKNTELEKINAQLQEFLETEEKLMEEEYKSKAAKELREEIGTKIEKLISELQNVKSGQQQQKLPALIEKCREVMNGVRSALQELMPDNRRDNLYDKDSHS